MNRISIVALFLLAGLAGCLALRGEKDVSMAPASSAPSSQSTATLAVAPAQEGLWNLNTVLQFVRHDAVPWTLVALISVLFALKMRGDRYRESTDDATIVKIVELLSRSYTKAEGYHLDTPEDVIRWFRSHGINVKESE